MFGFLFTFYFQLRDSHFGCHQTEFSCWSEQFAHRNGATENVIFPLNLHCLSVIFAWRYIWLQAHQFQIVTNNELAVQYHVTRHTGSAPTTRSVFDLLPAGYHFRTWSTTVACIESVCNPASQCNRIPIVRCESGCKLPQEWPSILFVSITFLIFAGGCSCVETRAILQAGTMRNWLLWIRSMCSTNKCGDFGMKNHKFISSMNISRFSVLDSYVTQVNACFVASMVNRDFTRILDRLNFYSNTTACILAKARCNPMNPITGELQQQLTQIYPIGLTNGVGTAGFYNHNALQIAPNGDIKIIAFPSSIITGDYFCSTSATLEQSLYDGITCIVPWKTTLFRFLNSNIIFLFSIIIWNCKFYIIRVYK